MNVREYLAANKLSINALVQATGIAYTTLHPHVTKGKQLSFKTAEKLETWSKGKMTAAEILGLVPPAARPGPPPKPTRRSRKAATPSMRKAGAAEPVEASPVSSKTPRAAKVAPALPLKATGT